jgi:GGDEF domain-containing protein
VVKSFAHSTDVISMALNAEQVIPPAASRTYEALFDAATRLPGWPLLIDRTAVALTRARRNGSQVLVAVLGDVRAHRELVIDVRAVVATLRDQLRGDDTIGRVDERTLIIVCNDVSFDSDAAQIVRRLIANSNIDCTMGISLSAGHDDARSLLTAAVRDGQQQRAAV